MHEIAYNRVSGLFWSRGPHHVAENFGNTSLSVINFGNDFKNWIFFSRIFAKIGIFDFSFWQGAPGQKFLYGAIPIDLE